MKTFRRVIPGKSDFPRIIRKKSDFVQRISPQIKEKNKLFLTFISDLLAVDSWKKRDQKSHATVPLRKLLTMLNMLGQFQLSSFLASTGDFLHMGNDMNTRVWGGAGTTLEAVGAGGSTIGGGGPEGVELVTGISLTEAVSKSRLPGEVGRSWPSNCRLFLCQYAGRCRC